MKHKRGLTYVANEIEASHCCWKGWRSRKQNCVRICIQGILVIHSLFSSNCFLNDLWHAQRANSIPLITTSAIGHFDMNLKKTTTAKTYQIFLEYLKKQNRE